MPQSKAHGENTRITRDAREAIAAGREVLTPQAAMDLFHLSESAVRKARRKWADAVRDGHLKNVTVVRFILTVTDKPVHMMSLDWALRLWGPLDHDGEERLQKMKESPHIFGLYGKNYLVLHPKQVASGLSDADMYPSDDEHSEIGSS